MAYDGPSEGVGVWWIALSIACGDADRVADLEARVAALEAKQASLQAELAEAKAAALAAPAPTASAPDPALRQWPVREVEPGRYTVDFERLAAQVDEQDWPEQGRAIPHRGPDGDIDGYRLSGIRANSVLVALGLKNGDVLHSLNDIALVDVDAGMKAYELAQRRERLEASISRRGEEMQLVWEPGTVPASE